MPLIIITGLPTSGKSTRAAQLHAYLSEKIQSQASPQPGSAATPPPKYRLHLISDQTLSIDRSVYDLSPSRLPAHTRSANASEKDARAALYGAVKRVLSPRDIVLLDGLNYIKGWRYQLYCEAKNLRTPNAVLQVGCAVERARSVNEERIRRRDGRAGDGAAGTEQWVGGSEAQKDSDDAAEEPYEPSNWENLVFRYEEPNAMNRWDSPLFTLIWEDDEAQTRKVFDDLWEAIAGEGRKAVKPNQVALPRGSTAGGDFLYVLDRETQDIVKKILELQGDDGGAEVRISRGGPAGGGDDLVVELPGKKVGLPQLQRYRRAFIAMNRGGIGLEGVGNLAVSRLRESFVGYLNDAFENEE
ncbi:Chromatin associated protein KTI12 [Pleurostoma richardsiae]|uniref:Chromatin associated protein KTI12 n=1 Tax=Pleurostoma richardsiae TaxID=41990 RepID=A0AA38VIV4_9PEZI|nr:Chromatin associated protein KTI12 [Pleurostoma richardsiae]